VEEIVQQRNPKDYAYVSKKVETVRTPHTYVYSDSSLSWHHSKPSFLSLCSLPFPFPSPPQAGCNEPQVFTVFTKGGKFHRMVHGGFKALLQEYERLRKKEDKARKEAAIKAKMDAAYAKVGQQKERRSMAEETGEEDCRICLGKGETRGLLNAWGRE
jgi:hypothetical protein